MKHQWHHPETPETGRRYWRSLGELEKSPEFSEWLDKEFPQGAAEFNNPEAGETSRRNFLKYMGAATALAGFGLSGCRRPLLHVVPYNEHVEWIVPGKPLLFASAKPRPGGRGCDPLVVTTHEGRPTKVDGNRLHPEFSGGSDGFTQASVLNLYDPDRSKTYLNSGEKSSKEAFEAGFLNGFLKGKGEKAALLIGESSSPTRARLLEALAKRYPQLQVFQYEPLSAVGLKAAELELFGEGVSQVPHLDRAEKILALDCDFIGLDKVGNDPVAEFSKGRKVDGEGKPEKMNRLYVVEPAFTLTGGMADHRLRLPASQVAALSIALASEVAAAAGDDALASAIKPALANINPAVLDMDWIAEVAKDLAASKGKALVLAGSQQPKEVHLLVAAMNASLGSLGGADALISLVKSGVKSYPGLPNLAKAIADGKVDKLILTTEADLLFDAPADLNFGDLFAKITTVDLSSRRKQTAQKATWHVPGTHYLEEWGDLFSATGVYSVVQPTIFPLYEGVSEIEFYLSLLAEPPVEGEEGKEEVAPAAPLPGQSAPDAPALAEVKKTFEAVLGGGDVKKAWNATLRDGFLTGSSFPSATGSVDFGKVGATAAVANLADLPYPESLEVILVPGSATYDGRYANNGWLQEVGDPITKLTWDNAALVSWKTAEDLGLKDGQMLELNSGGRTLKVPVTRNPGQADNTIMLALGYYGTLMDEAGDPVDAGSIATGVGFNVYPLRTTTQPYFVTGVKLHNLGGEHLLAFTAEHYSMEGRALAREGTLEMFEADEKKMAEAKAHGHEGKSFIQAQGMDAHIPENISAYKGPNYMEPEATPEPAHPLKHFFKVDPNHQWAMTVDLHACTGCNACSIACQAENNIPIVGKDQVSRGREMHWIRMDRYFSSPYDAETVSSFTKEKGDEPGRRRVDPDNVEMIPQPVACVQCENAPCETVCPVNATVHTGDGLNAMTYNRCIGTRYCANNCPYKARRFNYYDYNKRPIDKLALGPLAPAAGRATTTEQLQKNPNVTVRMRGVIEKCTYCVQRISTAKIAAKVDARDSSDVMVPANSVTTACQDACSTGAITFGNWKNPDDMVAKIKGDPVTGEGQNPRNYDLLKYIGTRPRTSYLGRIKNPNPKMPGAAKVGQMTAKMH